MENGTERYIETVIYLSKLYDYCNDKLFGSELKRPVMTVQTDARNKTYGWWSCHKVWKENAEDDGEYAKKTGTIIIDTFKDKNIGYNDVPAVIFASHGPFTWGKNPKKAVENAIILEEVAFMAWHTVKLNDKVKFQQALAVLARGGSDHSFSKNSTSAGAVFLWIG